MTIFSGHSVISRVYTSRFGNGTARWNLDRSGTKKVSGTRYSTQWKTPQKWTVPYRTVPYHAVEKRHLWSSILSIVKYEGRLTWVSFPAGTRRSGRSAVKMPFIICRSSGTSSVCWLWWACCRWASFCRSTSQATCWVSPGPERSDVRGQRCECRRWCLIENIIFA